MKPFPASRYALYALLVASGLGLDLYSKHAIFAWLGYPHGTTPWRKLVGEQAVQFQLHTSFNHGALWGLGQGLTWVFASLSLVAVVSIGYWLFRRGAAASVWLTTCLSLVTAGALGNLFDRLGLHGCRTPEGEPVLAVRDFLYFRFGAFDWPVFNVADVCLVTGAIMLVIQSFFLEDRSDAATDGPSVAKSDADPLAPPEALATRESAA